LAHAGSPTGSCSLDAVELRGALFVRFSDDRRFVPVLFVVATVIIIVIVVLGISRRRHPGGR
jgi:hypothetical protein